MAILSVALCDAAMITLSPLTEATAFACLSRDPFVCNIGTDQQFLSSGVAAVTGNYGSPAVGAQLSVSATGDAGFGVLRAGVSSTFDIAGPPALAYGSASGRFRDIITISYAPFTGQQGFLGTAYTLSGNVSRSGIASAFAEVNIAVGESLEQKWSAVHDTTTSGVFFVPKSFTYTYGTPFGLEFDLTSVSGTIRPRVSTDQGAGFWLDQLVGRGAGTADFANTLILSRLIATDEFGAPVSGAQITSASGTHYTSAGVLPNAGVPEPSSTLMLGSGLIIIVALFFKRGNQRDLLKTTGTRASVCLRSVPTIA